MARKSDPTIREDLLNACAEAAIHARMRDLTLAGLAKGTNVSRRMLIYHFGSVEQLIEETLLRVQTLMRDKLHVALANDPSRNSRRAILTFLEVGIAPDMERTINAYFYLNVECLGAHEEHRDFIEFTVPGWIAWAKLELAGHTPQVTDEDLTLVFSILRGMLLDYWATRDRERVMRALTGFVAKYPFGESTGL